MLSNTGSVLLVGAYGFAVLHRIIAHYNCLGQQSAQWNPSYMSNSLKKSPGAHPFLTVHICTSVYICIISRDCRCQLNHLSKLKQALGSFEFDVVPEVWCFWLVQHFQMNNQNWCMSSTANAIALCPGNICPSYLTACMFHRMFRKGAEQRNDALIAVASVTHSHASGFTPFEPLSVHFLEMFRLLCEISLLLQPHLRLKALMIHWLFSLLSVSCAYFTFFTQVVILWYVSLFAFSDEFKVFLKKLPIDRFLNTSAILKFWSLDTALQRRHAQLETSTKLVFNKANKIVRKLFTLSKRCPKQPKISLPRER